MVGANKHFPEHLCGSVGVDVQHTHPFFHPVLIPGGEDVKLHSAPFLWLAPATLYNTRVNHD